MREQKMQPSLVIWAFGDAHIATDLKKERHSFKQAVDQIDMYRFSDGSPLRWDLAINIGDMSGSQGLPDDREGKLVADAYRYLTHNQREDVYDICGNHDRSGLSQSPNEWFRKWIDPMGENPEYSKVRHDQREYPPVGTYERYCFQVGNILFLMMSDINEPSQEKGRGDYGGNPSGVVSKETFEWWRRQLKNNQDKIIISAHHYMLKDTTVASGEYEGFSVDEQGAYKTKYHGYYPQSTPKGASYLYWVGGKQDAQAFEGYLEKHERAMDCWIGGHTHTHPTDRTGGKSHVETKWGVHFVNVAALSAHHAFLTTYPMSRFLLFYENESMMRILCFDHNKAEILHEQERIVTLRAPFRFENHNKER